MAIFFVIAGLNHFLDPDFYYPLIPRYLKYIEVINIISGLLEILLGFGLLIKTTRYVSAISIGVLMICFIPSHIYFSKAGACFENSLCVPIWLSWLRLILIQPLLIWAAWFVR